MRDAIILAGKHALLSFELFQNLQRTYSWMKYYNNELESGKPVNEKIEILEDVRKSIYRSFGKLKGISSGSEDKMCKTTTVDTSSNSVVTIIIDY